MLRPVVNVPQSQDDGHGPRLFALSRLGAVLFAQRRWEEAEAALSQAYDGLAAQVLAASEVEGLETTAQRLIDLYGARRQTPKAAALRQRLIADLARVKASLR